MTVPTPSNAWIFTQLNNSSYAEYRPIFVALCGQLGPKCSNRYWGLNLYCKKLQMKNAHLSLLMNNSTALCWWGKSCPGRNLELSFANTRFDTFISSPLVGNCNITSQSRHIHEIRRCHRNMIWRWSDLHGRTEKEITCHCSIRSSMWLLWTNSTGQQQPIWKTAELTTVANITPNTGTGHTPLVLSAPTTSVTHSIPSRILFRWWLPD